SVRRLAANQTRRSAMLSGKSAMRSLHHIFFAARPYTAAAAVNQRYDHWFASDRRCFPFSSPDTFMKLHTLFSTFTLASLLAFPALSSPLNDYNLILTGNYNYGGGEVQGAAFVGGNLNASGKAPTFSTRTFTNPVGLTVVGDMYASNINMNS